MALDDLQLPDLDDVAPERRPFFEALTLLRDGDYDAALKAFRRAARKAEPPFDTLSAIGAAECQHALGKSSAALATLHKITAETDAPDAMRIAAWRKIAIIEEARDNRGAVEAAIERLEALGDVALKP